jgi:hypothetical protein
MFRFLLFALFAGLVALLAAPNPALASDAMILRPAILPFHLPVSVLEPRSSIPSPTPVASWTLLGCWRSRPWVTTCYDVFRDEAGVLYVCKACGTTGNPSKGKCRQTTQAELDGGTWCSATE